RIPRDRDLVFVDQAAGPTGQARSRVEHHGNYLGWLEDNRRTQWLEGDRIDRGRSSASEEIRFPAPTWDQAQRGIFRTAESQGQRHSFLKRSRSKDAKEITTKPHVKNDM